MDSSERDESMEQPIRDSDEATPEREVDLADEEGFPAPVPHQPDARVHEEPAPEELIVHAPPMEPAEPGMYYCEAEDPGIHPVLGRLVQGENDFTSMTHPEALMALAHLVDAGVLKKVDA